MYNRFIVRMIGKGRALFLVSIIGSVLRDRILALNMVIALYLIAY